MSNETTNAIFAVVLIAVVLLFAINVFEEQPYKPKFYIEWGVR